MFNAGLSFCSMNLCLDVHFVFHFLRLKTSLP